MKLYVWEDVLRDYTAGMIVALAPDLESAMFTVEDGSVLAEMGRVQPTVVEIASDTPAQSWFVWGGG